MALLAVGRPSGKLRHVSSSVCAGEGAGQQTSSVADKRRQKGSFKGPASENTDQHRQREQHSMAYREFSLGKTSRNFCFL